MSCRLVFDSLSKHEMIFAGITVTVNGYTVNEEHDKRERERERDREGDRSLLTHRNLHSLIRNHRLRCFENSSDDMEECSLSILHPL